MAEHVSLPEPVVGSDVDEAFVERHSTKRYAADSPLDLRDVGAALFAAGGVFDGRRVVPSARRTHPILLTLVAGDVVGLAPATYRYDAESHDLRTTAAGDSRPGVASATLDAPWLAHCPALILMSADLAAARARFADQPPDHGERFVWIEAGHAAQNVYVWAAQRALGTALIAGLNDDEAAHACRGLIPPDHQILGILAVGSAAASGSQRS